MSTIAELPTTFKTRRLNIDAYFQTGGNITPLEEKMKSIFHGRKTLTRLSLFVALGFITFWGVFTYLSAHGHELGSAHTSLREHIELNSKAPFVYKKYTGPQNVQELMKALDADYNKSLAKTKVSASGKFTAKTTKTGKVTGTKTTTYSSDLTLSEIDARYPRAEWLQLLLDKGITVDDSLEYASFYAPFPPRNRIFNYKKIHSRPQLKSCSPLSCLVYSFEKLDRI